jgi:hypothetical protein
LRKGGSEESAQVLPGLNLKGRVGLVRVEPAPSRSGSSRLRVVPRCCLKERSLMNEGKSRAAAPQGSSTGRGAEESLAADLYGSACVGNQGGATVREGCRQCRASKPCLWTILFGRCALCILSTRDLHKITAGTVNRLAKHLTQVRVIAAAWIPLLPVYIACSSEQRHEFKTRHWLTPNGINPTTEHTVTA